MDVFFAFPPILLAIGIAAVLGAGPGSAVVAIAAVYAPLFFRVVRGSEPTRWRTWAGQEWHPRYR
jgi:peptide/nickel transport system permease protein